MMKSIKGKKDFEIITKGQFWVNLPVATVMLLTWYLVLVYFNLDYRLSGIIGFAIGWLFWEVLIRKWIRWCLDNNVEPERILKLGKRTLLLWGRREIDEILKKRGD